MVFFKKEFRVSIDICVYKDALDRTNYDEHNLEELINDIFQSKISNSIDDGPLWVQYVQILNIDKEWEIELN